MISKIIKITIVVIILAALGIGAYWIFDRQQSGKGLTFENNLNIGDFFPFGTPSGTETFNSNTTNTGTNNENNTNNPTPVTPQRLWQISNEPQSGAVVFISSSTPIVRFADRATGHIFESSLKTLGLKRITNTTIPKTYEASWQPNGKSLIIRYIEENNETIKTAFSTIGNNTHVSTNNQNSTTTQIESIQELETTFFANNISDIATNPLSGAFGYILQNQSNAQIFVTNPDGSNAKQIFESPVRDLLISWVGNNLSVLSKPSSGVPGQFYFLKTDGSLTRIMGGKNGLVALSNPTGTKVFFSESKNSSFVSGIYDPKTGLTTSVPFSTIPDKCVWSTKTSYIYCAAPRSIPAGQYPDHWYQGKISFVDEIWRIDTNSGTAEFIIDPNTLIQNGTDAVSLILDQNEEYLVFTNKKDSLLWGLKIASE